jgi:potassium efflux system protein
MSFKLSFIITEAKDMQNTTNKIIGFLIVSALILLPVLFSELQAQQTATPSSTAVSSSLSIEELKSRRIDIENMTDIDTAVKADSIKHIDRAISHLELAQNANKRADELSGFIRTAPKRLKILHADLKKPIISQKKIEARLQRTTMAKLEEQLLQEKAELSTAESGLREWSDRLSAEKAVVSQTAEQLAAAASRLIEIQKDLEVLPDSSKTDVLNHSKIVALLAERGRLAAEIKLNELRQHSNNLLVDLYSAERDVAQRVTEKHKRNLKSLQAEVQKRRQQEATQAREDAQEAIEKAPLLPKIVQDQFDINIQLSTELEKITQNESDLARDYESNQTRLKVLEEEFETAKKRVKSAVLTEAIGLALRTQRLNLPDANQYLAESDVRQVSMSEISERQIELNGLYRELSDPKILADRIIGSVSFLSEVDRKSLDSKIQELVTNRQDIIGRLQSGYDRIFKLLQDIEFTEQKMVTTAEDFGELLDRHLLWIRSSKPISMGDIHKLRVSLGWFFKPANWHQLLDDIALSFRDKTVTWIIGILIGSALVFSRGWIRRKFKDISELVEQQVDDSFILTIKALGLTVFKAVLVPFLIVFPAIQLARLLPAHPFSIGIAGGLIYATPTLVVLSLFYNICRSNGLAQSHFQWPESIRLTLQHNLKWLIPFATVSAFFLGAMETVPEFEYSDSLAKLALIVQALAVSTFFARILRFSGGITSVLIQKYPKSWLCRLRYLWYPLVILTPLFIICLAVIGYYYSAIEIRNLVRSTTALFFALIVFNDLMLRMLKLARRSIALRKTSEAEELKYKTPSDTKDPTGTISVDRPSGLGTSVKISQIDEQTRKLLKLVMFSLTLAGIWAIWASVFPAFGILEDIHFWSYSTVVDGVSRTVPITLANVLLAIIVVVITVIANRNLPGLLEVILLNRLTMDPGARYAYSTICRYAVTAIGIIVAFNAIGIKWASLQWLVAALGVGLGFGLQEIVANFICGLIVLFERPFRVGDTVTIGDVSGTVSRIRIRATTVVDWDRKELIVPNKEFIVGRLINWSLSDKHVRIRIPVGIAYGSDTKLAEELLMQAARKNPRVLTEPPPDAVFKGFGDNSLNFELRVFINGIDNWYPMLHQLNVTIDNTFKEAGVTIAFPQRDVHLDATGPLEVRVVSKSSDSESSKRSSAAEKEPKS